jgi:hypothetical protein
MRNVDLTRQSIEQTKKRLADLGCRVNRRTKRHFMNLRHAALSADLDILREEAIAKRQPSWATL